MTSGTMRKFDPDKKFVLYVAAASNVDEDGDKELNNGFRDRERRGP